MRVAGKFGLCFPTVFFTRALSTRALSTLALSTLALFALVFSTGCQVNQAELGYRMMVHAASVNSAGLTPAVAMDDINVRAAVPQGWEMMDTVTRTLYVHQQWRSPSHTTGFGVAYIHMPLPMSAKTLVWFAKGQYSKMNAKAHLADPNVMGEWTDSLGREWFEGENEKYHVKGYVVTSGFDAWAVYTGYRIKLPPNKADISLAFRGMDSIVPLPLEKDFESSTAADAADASGKDSK